MNNKMKRFCTGALIAALCIILVSCNKSSVNITKELTDRITELEEQVLELQNDLASKDNDLNFIMEERDYYRSFLDKILGSMNEKELLNIAKSEWSYSIRLINGELENQDKETPVQKDGRVQASCSSFSIILSERQPVVPVLKDYPELHSKGAISGNLASHLKVLEYTGYEMHAASGTVVDSIIYYFKDVPEGTSINLEVSDELKERAGLDVNTITISVIK